MVQRMFTLYAEGINPTEIARRLNEDGVPTPTQHKRAIGSKRQLWNSERKENFWRATTIGKILHDERYTGKLVALKTSRAEVGNIRSAKPITENGWIVIPGAFEAIVSQEIFDLVQERYAQYKPRQKTGPIKRTLFFRKLRCGHYGAALERHEISQGVYYACDGQAWNGTADCKKIRIFEADLIRTVLASICFQAQLAKKKERQLGRQTNNTQMEQNRVQSVQQRIQQRIAQLETQKAETFLSYDLGEISQAKYRERCIKLGAAITEQKRRLETLEKSDSNSIPSTDIAIHGEIQELASLSNLRTLDQNMVEELIYTIRVYSGNRVEIAWNFNKEHTKALISEKGSDHEGRK